MKSFVLLVAFLALAACTRGEPKPKTAAEWRNRVRQDSSRIQQLLTVSYVDPYKLLDETKRLEASSENAASFLLPEQHDHFQAAIEATRTYANCRLARAMPNEVIHNRLLAKAAIEQALQVLEDTNRLSFRPRPERPKVSTRVNIGDTIEVPRTAGAEDTNTVLGYREKGLLLPETHRTNIFSSDPGFSEAKLNLRGQLKKRAEPPLVTLFTNGLTSTNTRPSQ